MILSRIRIGSKVRITGFHRHGEVGFVDDMSVELNDKAIKTVYVTIRLPIPDSKFFEPHLFDIDEVERVEVAEVKGQQMKVAA